MHNQELILLTHVSTESVNDGFLSAALLTVQAHLLVAEFPRICAVYRPIPLKSPLDE